MRAAFEALPKGRACLIGGDIPGVEKRHIAEAFAALGAREAVFGPATDGGFWLTGFRRSRPLPPRLFEGVRWSSAEALADSIATLNGQSHALVAALSDVDTAADLSSVPRR